MCLYFPIDGPPLGMPQADSSHLTTARQQGPVWGKRQRGHLRAINFLPSFLPHRKMTMRQGFQLFTRFETPNGNVRPFGVNKTIVDSE
jgi:hypothetical protein